MAFTKFIPSNLKKSFKRIRKRSELRAQQRYRNKYWSDFYSHLNPDPLSKDEKIKFKNLWGGVCPYVSDSYSEIAIYKKIRGFNEEIVPWSIFSPYMLPSLNSMWKQKVLENKALYPDYLAHISQPPLLISKINGLLYDADKKIINLEKALDILKNYKTELVFKPAIDSYGGSKVVVATPCSISLKETLINLGNDFVIQKRLKQCSFLDKLNDTSLNTIRITSLFLKDGVHVLSSQLKISLKGAKVDNASFGSVLIDVDANGKLADIGYGKNGIPVKTQNGITFGNLQIPNWNKVTSFVKESHMHIPTCRIIGWDIAIDENDNPIMIEANMSSPGIIIEQFCSGPIFGKHLSEIIEMVEKYNIDNNIC